MATEIPKDLTSVYHVCRDLNAVVTDDVRGACFEMGTYKTLHECNMADGIYTIYNLEVGSEV